MLIPIIWIKFTSFLFIREPPESRSNCEYRSTYTLYIRLIIIFPSQEIVMEAPASKQSARLRFIFLSGAFQENLVHNLNVAERCACLCVIMIVFASASLRGFRRRKLAQERRLCAAAPRLPFHEHCVDCVPRRPLYSAFDNGCIFLGRRQNKLKLVVCDRKIMDWTLSVDKQYFYFYFRKNIHLYSSVTDIAQ